MDIQFNCPLSVSDLSDNHCDLCQHKLIDCTSRSEAEIYSLAGQSKKFCGIFKSSQIRNRNQSFNQTLFKIAFVFVFVLGLNEAKASTFIQQDIEASYQSFENNIVSDTLENSPVLQGVIKNDLGEIIPYAKVTVETSSGVCFYAITDLNGAYKISLKDIPVGTIVSVSSRYIGLQSVVITNVKLELNTIIDITMQTQELIIIGLLILPEHQMIPYDPYDFGKQKVVIEEKR